MLDILGSHKSLCCDGARRRDFLKVGALGMTGLALAPLRACKMASASRVVSFSFATCATAVTDPNVAGNIKMRPSDFHGIPIPLLRIHLHDALNSNFVRLPNLRSKA